MVDFSNLQNLLGYYIECVEIESLEEFSLPSFNENEKFIIPRIESEWSSKDEKLNINLGQGLRRNLALNRQYSSLYYGWPTYIRPDLNKNGNVFQWLEPLFLLKVEYEEYDFEENSKLFQLTLIKEWPKINDSILKRFAKTFEERIQILNLLGLSDAENIPPNGLIEYWNKFQNLYPDLPQLSTKINDVKINTIREEGFYSIPFIIVANTSKYSRQLLRELRTLKKSIDSYTIKETALEFLLNGKINSKSKVSRIHQITPLNRSQRKAILDAFSNSISVITGPPGTGKSQVVLNILVNAFKNNLSVLFTSKNNKAVDVVCERILKNVKFPINLRLGSKTETRDYTTEFLDLLNTVLAGGNKDAIISEYNRIKKFYENIKNSYYEMLNKFEKIVEIRNRINKLDEKIENYESVFDKNIIVKAKKLKYQESPFIDLAKKELNLLKISIIGLYRINSSRYFQKLIPLKKSITIYLNVINLLIEF